MNELRQPWHLCLTLTDPDECLSSPCQNRGMCIDHLNEYTCECKPGFNGSHCETSKCFVACVRMCVHVHAHMDVVSCLPFVLC